MAARDTRPAPTIVWFRDDLRLSDHPALSAAAKTGAPLVCLYVLDEHSAGLRSFGGASRWWLAQSLRALDEMLRKHGQRLVLRRGAAARIVPALARETGADRVHWNRRYDQPGRAADAQVIDALKADGIGGSTFAGNLLAEPGTVTGKEGGPKVFTPFWKRLRALEPRQPLPAPRKLAAPPKVDGDQLEDWTLEPSHPDWARGFRDEWTPGETGARLRLRAFLKDSVGYGSNRDRPDRTATSRLSPHLRFGEISVADIFHAARFAADEHPAAAGDIEKFLSEIGWREFSYHLLHHHPMLATNNLQPRFDAFPWQCDAKALRVWQRGLTGYPIVDAGMRQLWQTGWMHNRVRMVAASFLVKHLLLDWRAGEMWFWDTLVDADPANNPASWQWVAGCGADAAPYFRIFNPVLQGEKFDPNGDYVRRWVPEVAALPDEWLHKPWDAPAAVLKDAGLTLGRDYPKPIVDHKAARERALAALKETRA
ncbi:MAG: deoxyribodipyrimidine photo-lyase [Rhizobiales bacterium]|nr:deoxyribodipyrimidine photo-lyase [Hyphomicrobiales bacterium]OJY42491.1 MAG: deoxyribodipyrimidine photolyase [Rhizobiales bacterium 64-17]